MLSEHLTDTYTYENEGQIYYVSTCYGVTFHLGKELPKNFHIKDNREEGYFGIFYEDEATIEPVYVFKVIQKDAFKANDEMPLQKIYHEYDNGLCIVNSLIGFNGSSIDYTVWNNIINPFIDTVEVYFE